MFRLCLARGATETIPTANSCDMPKTNMAETFSHLFPLALVIVRFLLLILDLILIADSIPVICRCCASERVVFLSVGAIVCCRTNETLRGLNSTQLCCRYSYSWFFFILFYTQNNLQFKTWISLFVHNINLFKLCLSVINAQRRMMTTAATVIIIILCLPIKE